MNLTLAQQDTLREFTELTRHAPARWWTASAVWGDRSNTATARRRTLHKLGELGAVEMKVSDATGIRYYRVKEAS